MTDPIPYGGWPSPIDAGTVAAGTIDFGGVAMADGTAYWLERRPDEDGRGVVVCRDPGDADATPVTPDDTDVRTLVHEYGGGDFAVHGGTVIYAGFEDQRLYRLRPDGDPEPITPAPSEERASRFADITVTPDGRRLYCVRERHGVAGAEEPVNDLVTLPTDGTSDPTAVAAGHDFYATPRLDPAGERLVWLTWDHPRMPWDGTTLRAASVAPDGTLTDERELLGGPEESVFQPAWGPEGTLYAVSDRTGWWNLYRIDPADGTATPLHEVAAEFGAPQWTFDTATYTPLADGRLAAIRDAEGSQTLGVLDPETGAFEPADLPYNAYPHPRIATDGTAVLTMAAGPETPPSVLRWDPGGEATLLRRAFEPPVEPAAVSVPEHITVPTADGETAYAYYYPPHNPDVTPPEDEAPPLVTMVHGGPTSRTYPALDLDIQYFTTRGIGVIDVNYRGSTGYGRAYRDRLDGEWGVLDVADCVDAARYVADRGEADPDRLAIRGGSAGGFATLAALAFRDAFDAGVSYYGVADLRGLAETTHKFESRYLDRLVGPLPEAAEVYLARSPADGADGIAVPLLVLQGGEDRVVPPEQAEAMVDRLVANDVAYAYVEFPEERHGFRTAAARERALETELGFYATVFGFEPADGPEPLDLVAGRFEKRTVDPG